MNLHQAIGAVAALMALIWILVPLYCVWSLDRELDYGKDMELGEASDRGDFRGVDVGDGGE